MARLSRSLQTQVQAGLFAGLLLASALLVWASGIALREVGEAVMLSRLQHDAESLLGVLGPGDDGWSASAARITRVYEQPFSGHYWQASIQNEARLLTSRSLWDQTLTIPTLAPGQSWTGHAEGPRGQALIIRAAGFRKHERDLTLAVAEDLAPVEAQIRRIQWWSAAALSALAAGLLLLQHLLLRRSFSSLADLKQGVDDLRHGRRDALDEALPSEVQPVAIELNRLLRQMQQRLNHSRNALGNLAHALKAPVSVLIHDLERDNGEAARQQSLRQAHRLRELIQRELRRARMATAGRPAQAFRPREHGEDLIDSLRRLHRDRGLDLSLDVDAPEALALDLEDMLELLGNLLDNACKWAQSRVRCRIRVVADAMLLEVADDGQGVSAEALDRLTERGLRIDESVEGSGLGLAIVKDLVAHYRGELSFAADPELGGLRVQVRLPLLAGD